MKKIFLSASPVQTKKIGKELAKKIIKSGPKNTARTLALEGDLGGGKTTFLQGLAKGLGIDGKILSPTFMIMKKFKVPCTPAGGKRLRFENFYHLDCYRIKDAKEVSGLGFKKILSSPENIIAIEWSERISKILPGGLIRIKFEFVNNKKRKITTFK